MKPIYYNFFTLLLYKNLKSHKKSQRVFTKEETCLSD